MKRPTWQKNIIKFVIFSFGNFDKINDLNYKLN